jgi:hybrid polyketide synthase/nonribosomal peptide synthetase ACE1
MSFDAMRRSPQTKIEGSYNLNQAFHDDDLDFFILFSSGACVVGNSGQANYAAANGLPEWPSKDGDVAWLPLH